jgi:hypothetical protein
MEISQKTWPICEIEIFCVRFVFYWLHYNPPPPLPHLYLNGSCHLGLRFSHYCLRRLFTVFCSLIVHPCTQHHILEDSTVLCIFIQLYFILYHILI